MRFKNIKISTKLFLAFLTAALLGTIVFYFASSSYTRAVDDFFYADILTDAISEEETAIWQFMAGDEQGEQKYLDAHGKIRELEALLLEKYGKIPERFLFFLDREREIYGNLYGENNYDGNNFFEDMRLSKSGFIDKNNKHIRRVLGYIEGWASLDADKRAKALTVLAYIRQERIYVDEFDPRAPDAEEIVNRFRKSNESAVGDLVDLWLEDFDSGMERASTAEIKSKIKTTKQVVRQITATSFPPVSERQGALLGIEANKETRFGNDAVEATRALSAACEESTRSYEEKGGKPLWKRADVSDVGEKVTPVFTLSKLVSCQQGLRLNAENLFDLKLSFVNNIEPSFSALKNDIFKLKEESSDSVSELSSRLKSSFFTGALIMLVLAFLVWLFSSYFIITPILNVRDAAIEIAKGNMNIKIDTSGKDEIAKLAQALDKMRQSLKVVLEEYEKKLREKIKR